MVFSELLPEKLDFLKYSWKLNINGVQMYLMKIYLNLSVTIQEKICFSAPTA